MLKTILEIYSSNYTGINVGVFTGVMSSLFVTGIFGLIKSLGLLKFYNQIEKDYAGNYYVYEKYKKDQDPIFDITLKTEKNFLHLDGIRIGDKTTFTGRLEVSRSLRDYVKGYYVHSPDGWGFIEFQRAAKGQIYAHHSWSAQSNAVTNPYTWIKK